MMAWAVFSCIVICVVSLLLSFSFLPSRNGKVAACRLIVPPRTYLEGQAACAGFAAILVVHFMWFLIRAFSNRDCVMAKSKRGIGRKWTAKEVALLKELYPECPIPEIAKRLGRTVAAITGRARYLELKRKSYLDKLWTAEEIQLLRELYPTHEDIQDIAERIGRSPAMVRAKAYSIGLRRHRIYFGEL